MCDLSYGILEEGIQQGKMNTTIKMVKQLMNKMNLSLDAAFDFFEIGNEEREIIKEMM